MIRKEIEAIVTEMLIDKLNISESEVNLDSSMKDMGADSLDEIEMVIEIEKKFSISIPDNLELESQNITGICNFIEKKIST